MYLVQFKDGTLLPVKIKPVKSLYQKEAKFFRISGNLTMAELSDWLGGWPVKTIREISSKERKIENEKNY